MIYLDYSATTPVNDLVLNNFLGCNNYGDGNIDEEKERVKKILNTNLDVIFTSGSTEANNLAIKGVANNYSKGRIITTSLEHSSIEEPLKYLESKGFIIDYVKLNKGIVDLNNLKKIISDDTILITIASVNTETGVVEPVNEIGLIAHENNILFHSDMTGSIGKINISLDNIDLISFSPHKFYGLKGVGCLLKRSDILLKPLFYGKRTYNYALIKSVPDALSLALKNIEGYSYIAMLNNRIREEIKNLPNVFINSRDDSIPHILNISITNFKPETFQHLLELNDIYVSTGSACHDNKDDSYSKPVYALSNDKLLASTSIRISLSHLTTEEDVNEFIKIFKECVGDNHE